MEARQLNNISSLIGRALQGAGLAALLSAAIVNPWTGALYHDPIENYVDVLGGYMICALLFGVLLICGGTGIARKGKRPEVGLLLLAISGIALLDRLLLAIIGLPYWVPDTDLHYRHRPNADRVSIYRPQLAQRQPIKINSHGWHDDEFVTEKKAGEYRGLIVGDSIVMGWGVPQQAAFANRLEQWLRQLGQSAQVINAGVEGYATTQERIVIEQGMIYSPDFIAVGFCMNDVNIPYVVDERLGGIGFDHDIIASPSYWAGWVMNETGYGRAIQWWRSEQYLNTQHELVDEYDVKEMMVLPPDDPKFKAGWDITLQELERIYVLGKAHGLPVYLLIFPQTQQLLRDDLNAPQQTLKAHAKKYGAYPIDFTPLFNRALQVEVDKKLPQSNALPRPVFHAAVEVLSSIYYLDDVHFTREGHRFVASVLLQALTQYKHIEVDPIKARRFMVASTQGTALPYVPVPGTRAELEIKMEALKALGMGDQAEEIERMFNARR